jgi:hypothetical protein
MKTFSPIVSLPAGKAAAIVAFSLLGLNAFGVQPGPATAAGAAVAGAHPVADSSAAPVAPEEDILDIRGPIHIPAAFPWAAWIAGSFAAAGIGVGAWVLIRRPHRKLPYEIALANLEKLRPLMQPENARVFSLAVSEIVRGFIEQCFPVRAAHRTTNEFLHDLVNLPDSPLAAHRETLAEFLVHCDLAKFARWSLTVPQMEAILASASTFVVAIGKRGAPVSSRCGFGAAAESTAADSIVQSTQRLNTERLAGAPVAAREGACPPQP